MTDQTDGQVPEVNTNDTQDASLDTPIVEQVSQSTDLAKYIAETKRARDEAAKYRTQRNDLKEQLDALESRLKTIQSEGVEGVQQEISSLREKFEAEQTARLKAEQEALRIRVASEYGLPPELAARLQGDSEAELKADAEKLQAILPVRGQAPKPGVGSPPATESKARELHQRIKRGSTTSAFDPGVHRQQGGGIVTKE